ncbi:hypothetical protein SDRG_00937 [Saprolegnia diclina VS20]|uniref:RNA methyltransferase n=1 Tax=Saprolegnia diclina (strain VS20) TaxID=1156394 RepID=T0R568_SAPDV|nr:hypothetical protein SDRG_00937 [Saprolegnia diclina VS20]EQC42096.1 hypothetical protein SDRG_00937 [Saprolegnia diclina VS20]|eukprot:XP_008604665.1 hypothetical protein SDRG_00937 [Saprolegnia diclina VS20]
MDADLAVEHVFGNFHDYYEFNPESERLRFLSPSVRAGLCSLLSGRRAYYLDIGCNEGKLTQAVHRALVSGALPVAPATTTTFSVDSISELNEAIQKHHVAPTYVTIEDGGFGHRKHFVLHVFIANVFFGAGDGVSKKVAKAKAAAEALARLAAIASPSDDAPTTVAPVTAAEPTSSNVDLRTLGIDVDAELIGRAAALAPSDMSLTFQVADVMEGGRLAALCDAFLSETEGKTFDLISCFSITMWIHLHHGDAGLLNFLNLVSAKTTHLILEPQPWKCYKTATRRLQRLHHTIPASFRAIQITHTVVDVIDKHLSDLFPYKTPLGKTNWSRPVMLYSKVPLPTL